MKLYSTAANYVKSFGRNIFLQQENEDENASVVSSQTNYSTFDS